jgi:hypothetical protein
LDSPERHHKADGIIFQPSDQEYKFFANAKLLIWQWSELRSVDLSVNIFEQSNNTGGKGILYDCPLSIGTTIDMFVDQQFLLNCHFLSLRFFL